MSRGGFRGGRGGGRGGKQERPWQEDPSLKIDFRPAEVFPVGEQPLPPPQACDSSYSPNAHSPTTSPSPPQSRTAKSPKSAPSSSFVSRRTTDHSTQPHAPGMPTPPQATRRRAHTDRNKSTSAMASRTRRPLTRSPRSRCGFRACAGRSARCQTLARDPSVCSAPFDCVYGNSIDLCDLKQNHCSPLNYTQPSTTKTTPPAGRSAHAKRRP